MSATRLPETDEDVIDLRVARILAMSVEEIRDELRAMGIDPDADAARFQGILDRAVVRAELLSAAGRA